MDAVLQYIPANEVYKAIHVVSILGLRTSFEDDLRFLIHAHLQSSIRVELTTHCGTQP